MGFFLLEGVILVIFDYVNLLTCSERISSRVHLLFPLHLKEPYCEKYQICNSDEDVLLEIQN